MSTNASEAVFAKHLVQELGGSEVHLIMHADSSSAIALANKQGPGRVKHIDIRHLWLQDLVRNKTLTVNKIHTSVNVADLGTKHHDAARLKDLRDMIGK